MDIELGCKDILRAASPLRLSGSREKGQWGVGGRHVCQLSSLHKGQESSYPKGSIPESTYYKSVTSGKAGTFRATSPSWDPEPNMAGNSLCGKARLVFESCRFEGQEGKENSKLWRDPIPM